MINEKEKPFGQEEFTFEDKSDEVVKVEKISQPEVNFEKTQEQKIESLSEGKKTAEFVSVIKPAPISPVNDEYVKRQKDVENIMSKGLEDLYLSLSPDEKREFRLAGEETAKQVNSLLSETKIKVNKIIDLIKTWLKLIPGVNRFFLEQETKIKVDEILQLKKGGE